MKTAAVIVALAGLSGAASAQALFALEVDKASLDPSNMSENGLVTVSLFLDRNGSTDGFFGDFTAWSQFAGQMNASAGSWVAPNEAAPLDGQPQLNTGDWIGRRPASATSFPGGSGGGFRFASQGYLLSNGGSVLLGDRPGQVIEGIAAPTALGGFLHDGSDRLEVFRAVLDLSDLLAGGTAGTVDISFAPAAAAVFIDPVRNISRSVLNLMTVSGASVQIVPAPAALSLLGLGGLAAARRRR